MAKTLTFVAALNQSGKGNLQNVLRLGTHEKTTQPAPDALKKMTRWR